MMLFNLLEKLLGVIASEMKFYLKKKTDKSQGYHITSYTKLHSRDQRIVITPF